MIEMDIKIIDGSANHVFSKTNGFSIAYCLNAFGITDTDWHTIQIKLTPTRISRIVDSVEVTGQNVTDGVSYWHLVYGLY